MIELRIERRNNRDGKPSVAPYINGWNVWDIPEREWTPAVEQAVLRAYELGWRHCNLQHRDVGDVMFPPSAKFESGDTQ